MTTTHAPQKKTFHSFVFFLTYVVFVDLDADVEHLTIGVGVGVVSADDFSGAGERSLGHVIVVVIRRTPYLARHRIHAPAQHAQRQQT